MATHLSQDPKSLQLHRVMERDGKACAYCGIPLLCLCDMAELVDEEGVYSFTRGMPEPGFRDQIIPRSRGGSDEDANIAPACNGCNASKNNRTPEEWRAAKALKAARS